MRRHHADHGVLIDPHTAVGLVAMEKARAAGALTGAVVTLATAHPAKFPEAVEKATGASPELPDRLVDLFDRRNGARLSRPTKTRLKRICDPMQGRAGRERFRNARRRRPALFRPDAVARGRRRSAYGSAPGRWTKPQRRTASRICSSIWRSRAPRRGRRGRSRKRWSAWAAISTRRRATPIRAIMRAF